jgi:hypothetical protein
MARTPKRTAEQIEQLLGGYTESGLSRRQYCEQQGITVATFDYYRHRQRKPQRGPATSSPLVRVKIANNAGVEKQELQSFTLVLAKGRRIESRWDYNDHALARLIRIVEAA